MIYLGGKHKNSLIELHDIRFAVANSIEECYPLLKNTWWGEPRSLHLDCWGVLKNVDGYDILLKSFPSSAKNKLYFVNLGGYDPLQFTELHKNICVVGEDEKQAKEKATTHISHWKLPHKDYMYNIEKLLSIEEMILQQSGMYIHLELSNSPSDFKFICQYTPI
jgi:hypothetical protein